MSTTEVDLFLNTDNVQRIVGIMVQFFYDKYKVRLGDRLVIKDVIQMCLGVQQELVSDKDVAGVSLKQLNLKAMTIMKGKLLDDLKIGAGEELPVMPGSGDIITPAPANVGVGVGASANADSDIITSDDVMADDVFQSKLQQLSMYRGDVGNGVGGAGGLGGAAKQFLLLHGMQRDWLEDLERNPIAVKGTNRPVTISRVGVPPRMADNIFIHLTIHSIPNNELMIECPLEWNAGSYRPLNQNLGRFVPSGNGDWLVTLKHPTGEPLNMGEDGYLARWGTVNGKLEVYLSSENLPYMRPGEDRVMFQRKGGALTKHVVRGSEKGSMPSRLNLDIDPPLGLGSGSGIIEGNLLLLTHQVFVYLEHI